MCEVPLPNGRRADLMAIDAKGQLTIVEIKVSQADLSATANGATISIIATASSGRCRTALAAILDEERFLPGEAGLLVADRYDAAIMREAPHRPLAPARRKAELLRFARRAARRLSAQIDPTLGRRVMLTGSIGPATIARLAASPSRSASAFRAMRVSRLA